MFEPILAGLFPLVVVEVAGGGLFQDGVEDGWWISEAAGVDRDVDDRAGGWDVEADLIRVVLENLIDNAWKYTRRTTSPRIEVTTEAGAFVVRDNGAGFSMDHAENLFRPYGRLHEDHDFPGTGIGLSTVFRVTDRHGGRVWAKGEVGVGATFYFTTG